MHTKSLLMAGFSYRIVFKQGEQAMTHILHLKAPGNWINDPNGFIFYKGKYHLFYQYFPFAPVWGTMHWGHAVSEDLVHWEHLGIALFPTMHEDRDGCFSGSALEHDGKLYLYYTGIHYDRGKPENAHSCEGEEFESAQLMISSEDGVCFDNFSDKRVVIPVIKDEAVGDRKDTRDPKVWQEGESFYMVLGSTYRKEMGRILFYKSRDGKNWEYGAQLQSARFGRILECPDIFRIGEGYVLIGSPMYIEKAKGYEHHAVCMPVEFDTGTCTLTVPEWEETGPFCQRYQYVDYGMDLYAPQTNVDRDGRRVMIGWMRMPKAVEKTGQTPWNGMMSLPRVIETEGGHIYFRIHPEVEKYFNQELPEEKRHILDFPCRIQTVLKDGESLDIGGYRIWVEQGKVKTDRSRVFDNLKGYHMVCETPRVREFWLDIFVDENLIEVFVNEGEYVLSNVVYGLGGRIEGHIERRSKGDS